MNRRGKDKHTEEIRRVDVHGDYITLGQLLKVAGVIGTGGEAKFFLADTAVLVNGEPEQRRGRKLRAGDVVQLPGEAPIHLRAGEAGEGGDV